FEVGFLVYAVGSIASGAVFCFGCYWVGSIVQVTASLAIRLSVGFAQLKLLLELLWC
ncbi:hypothetical protein U1Q18_030287, partial [Sarracenia purpurea var. burkii]